MGPASGHTRFLCFDEEVFTPLPTFSVSVARILFFPCIQRDTCPGICGVQEEGRGCRVARVGRGLVFTLISHRVSRGCQTLRPPPCGGSSFIRKESRPACVYMRFPFLPLTFGSFGSVPRRFLLGRHRAISKNGHANAG